MLKKIRNLVHRIAENRASSIVKRILPLVTGTGPILDFGCGAGHVVFQISLETGRCTHFLDVRSYPFIHPKVKVEIYDGSTIPYPDNFFETSFVIFTLHHTKNPTALLGEIVRVTSDNIIICEDLLKSRRLIFKEIIKDMISNCFYTKITMQYRTEEEWECLFEDCALRIVKKIYFNSNWFLRMKHVGWRLQIS